MRILVLTNLYPPHQAGSTDLRCQAVTDALQKRGHTLCVLTSNYGVGAEQRGREIERRLRLTGGFDQPPIPGFGALRALERHNGAVLRETLTDFQPELVLVGSLRGLSKSLTFRLRAAPVPTAYDVADDWIAGELRADPWLRWWNQTAPPTLSGLWRRWLELSGGRTRADALAPTRLMRGYDRIPEVYGTEAEVAAVPPASVTAFRFDRLYFCSLALKAKTANAGFQVEHGEVIYPGIRAEVFAGQIKPPSAPVKKLLLVTRLEPGSGATTALEALRLARELKLPVSLSIYGRGESAYIAQVRSFVVTHQLPVEFLTVANTSRDLAAVYHRHDALLYTAETEEPFAVAPLEAMAAGLPVIAAKSGGVRELVRHGENAFTYTPGDAPDLARRLQELQLQPALRWQVTETAQTEVLTKFNESVMVDQIEEFLQHTREFWQQT